MLCNGTAMSCNYTLHFVGMVYIMEDYIINVVCIHVCSLLSWFYLFGLSLKYFGCSSLWNLLDGNEMPCCFQILL
jgi:hypothetical protein